MSYSDFSIESIVNDLGLDIEKADLFPDLQPSLISAWLRETLDRGLRQDLLSEKARSEFLVVPILLACQELSTQPLAIFSGQRLDVDPARGLIGECDFILAATPPLPGLRAPLVTIVEAKRNDVEGGIWQCIAQMMGARLFNERSGQPIGEVFGCVTNGEVWQFLRLAGEKAEIERRHLYIDDVGSILAVFGAILGRHAGASKLA